jgi:CheY-like chemotaxis protein
VRELPEAKSSTVLVIEDADDVRQSTVLVVEDDDDVRQSIALILESDGFAAICAANGAEALASLKVELPDFVLLDLNMPVMNGFEFLKLKSQDRTIASIPVIAITADVSLSRPEGTVALLRKPFALDAFLNLLRTERERITPPFGVTKLAG